MQPSDSSICPTCGSPIPADAPDGLCPACALEGAASVANTTTGGTRTPPPSIEDIAPHFPELEILELLGAGGMGSVYKARQPQLDRTVALKILSHELTQEPAFVERFNREAKVLARLSHPNIVTVFDFGTAGPFCYLLMEYVDGVTLRQAMRTGGFKPAEALALVQDVCSALQFAHEEGILHRDIKPENVLVDSKGRVKIADFGIAKLVGAGAPSDVTLTLQGSILGSPHYMAPEQIETPGDVDQRADIYSLGVVLYEMLTGELPIGRFALPSQKAAMDARIDEIVLRTLEKEREARFQSAGEVGTQVAALADSAPPPPPVAAPAASGDSGSARFSLLSAILTGASLILVFVFLLLWNTLSPQPVSPAEYAESTARKLIPALLVLVPGLISALVGFILGARALADIRKSGGTMDGLGSAIFAVVAWPILIMAVSIFAALPGPMPGGMAMPITVLLAAIPPLLASFVLIRGLRRWARGVETKDGRRHLPGLTGTVLATLGLAVLGTALAVVVPGLFPQPAIPGPRGDIERPKPPVNSESASKPVPPVKRGDRAPIMSPFDSESFNSESESNVDWIQGHPQITVPVRLQAGVRANFLLVRRNEKGGESTTTIGQINASNPETVMVKVGAFEDSRTENDRTFELQARLRYADQHFMASAGTSTSGWGFSPSVSEAPVLAAGDRREFELANREETSKRDAPAESLYLVVETTPLNR